jgi:galactokinase/mevalonate kinase-like predicted kinase
MPDSIQHLVSLPPASAGCFAEATGKRPPNWLATADPPGRPLGSGGGTVHLLLEGWRGLGEGQSLPQWLGASRKLLVHGGGLSRRVPAYAAVGKPLMPVPVWRWELGQRIDQRLLDLQTPAYRRILNTAPPSARMMVTSGDVIIRLGPEPLAIPEADVVCMGLWVTPETACRFGVFFLDRDPPYGLSRFVQKPSTAQIRELAEKHLFLADSGMWLFSQRAIDYLMRRTQWSGQEGDLAGFAPEPYGLYEELGCELGTDTGDSGFAKAGLTSAVVPLPGAEFYHFGTGRDIIRSNRALQNIVEDQSMIGLMGAVPLPHPDQFVLNSRCTLPLRQDENHTLWIENACVPNAWQLANSHFPTNIPENDWNLDLPAGTCLDFAPVGDNAFAVRFYGIDDPFRGTAADGTRFMGVPLNEWFSRRGLPAPEGCVHDMPFYPVLEPGETQPEFIQWLIADAPSDNKRWADHWTDCRRLSAAGLLTETNVARAHAAQRRNMAAVLPAMARNYRRSLFYKLDLDATASLYAESGESAPDPLALNDVLDPMTPFHNRVFMASLERRRGEGGWEAREKQGFEILCDLITRQAEGTRSDPKRSVVDDQMVWGSSPLRMDLAGGWSDTPPYCLEFGGSVVNIAVDINGEPPIQVFARSSREPCIILNSIDQGMTERITTYEEVASYANLKGVFSIPKAALAIAGFLPRFNANGGAPSLKQQLEDFGGGIELSMLSAVPKGSGLGTSSILAATVLGVLGNLCALGWNRHDIFRETLMVEQMLTSGGGWQDQAGGLFHGIKMVETQPGLAQTAALRWVPDQLFSGEAANACLLYYTGITRTAHDILKEIVRGIFLNKREHLDTIGLIRRNAVFCFNALQHADRTTLCEAVRRSWELNQRLDAGTNPPQVARIEEKIRDYAAGYKLLGAGGGGYLLILAKDPQAAARIREALAADPPNPRARFVDFKVSGTGLRLTRS